MGEKKRDGAWREESVTEGNSVKEKEVERGK